MSHHYFIAYFLTDDEQKTIIQHQNELKKTIDHPINWTPAEDLHLTLCYLGPLSDEQIATTKSQLTELASTQPSFECNVIGHNQFKLDQSTTHILDCEQSNPLSQLRQSICQQLSNKQIPHDQRQYRPHITIGKSQETNISVKTLPTPTTSPIHLNQIVLAHRALNRGYLIDEEIMLLD